MKAQVIHYGVGNIFSISSALKRTGLQVEIVEQPKLGYDLTVMPGVGAFSSVSSFLNSHKGLLEDIKGSGGYILGICLGMQVMFQEGSEGGRSKGLGWFKGKVERLAASRVPHIGWEKIKVVGSCQAVEELDGKYFYFVHSYSAIAEDKREVKTISEYEGNTIVSTVCEGNILGTQFHPEKSGESGKKFLLNLSRMIRR